MSTADNLIQLFLTLLGTGIGLTLIWLFLSSAVRDGTERANRRRNRGGRDDFI